MKKNLSMNRDLKALFHQRGRSHIPMSPGYRSRAETLQKDGNARILYHLSFWKMKKRSSGWSRSLPTADGYFFGKPHHTLRLSTYPLLSKSLNELQ